MLYKKIVSERVRVQIPFLIPAFSLMFDPAPVKIFGYGHPALFGPHNLSANTVWSDRPGKE